MLKIMIWNSISNFNKKIMTQKHIALYYNVKFYNIFFL
jgi:hypothetical protein